MSGIITSLDSSQKYTSQSKDWLTEGKKLIAGGKFAEAVVALRRCKETTPEDARPYFFSGLALAELGRLVSSASELTEAVRLDPLQPEYALSLANVLTQLKQKSSAIKALASFEEREYENRLTTSGLWLLGDVYYRLGKEDEALRVFDLIVKRDPKDPRVDLSRGQIYKKKGQLDLAEQSFRKSIQKASHNAIGYFELGKLLEQRKEMTASRNALLEAVRQDEKNPEFRQELGAICLALNLVDDAIRFLEPVELSAPAFPQIYYVLGQAYLRKGDKIKASLYLRKVQDANSAQQKKKIQDQNELTLITMGEEKLEQGNGPEAAELFNQVLQANPNNWHANEYLAEMFLASEEWDLAFKHIAMLEQIDADSVEACYLMAVYCYHQKQYDRGRSFAEKARSIQPGHADLRNLLGNIYLKLGMPNQALREYSAAIRLAPDRADFQANYESLHKLIPER